MKNRNCPNCGSPLSLDGVKCEYCGTLVFDLTALDLTEGTPVFIKYRLPYNKENHSPTFGGKDSAYLTQCAIPHLEDVTVENETMDLNDRYGNVVHSVVTNRTCVSNLTFQAIPFGKKKELFRLEVPE